MVTCNRDDFVALAQAQPHHGLIMLFRRKSRTADRAVLVRLVEKAGEQGLAQNINFAYPIPRIKRWAFDRFMVSPAAPVELWPVLPRWILKGCSAGSPRSSTG